MMTTPKNDPRTWVLGALLTVNLTMGGFLVKVWWNDLNEVKTKLDMLVELVATKEADRRISAIQDWLAWEYQLRVNEVLLEASGVPNNLWPLPPGHLSNRGSRGDSTRWR